MVSSTFKFIIVLAAVLSVGGCYTVLMTPQEFLQDRQEDSAIRSDASHRLNYNQNCISCHSRAELDDRYLEMKSYGVMTVHNGIALEPAAWNNPYMTPMYEPDPYGWYTPVPSQPWWIPPATTVAGGGDPTTSTEKGNRVRETGSTRDNTGSRERSQSQPSPTLATPSQPVGGTTATPPSTPPPATTVAPQPATQQPAATTNSGERSRTDAKPADSNSGRTRDSGSSRDGNRPR